MDTVSKYPTNLKTLSTEKYALLDVDGKINNHLFYYPPKPKKQKHSSAFRTVSVRKWAGHKRNKPKYNWSKKRKARMIVWLS